MEKSILIVLDGFGIGKDSPFNAIKNAQMPFYRDLISKYPHSQLITHGEAVGLPGGVMGNSEVGHMTMGAGRIIYQDLTRISKLIEDKVFFKNECLIRTMKAGAGSRVHLMGLLSDGGVHSHLSHLHALLDMAVEQQIPHVSVHAFMDGRDTPPDSGIDYMRTLLQHPVFSERRAGSTQACVASISGRYYAMDRDKRWERVARAYQVLTGQAAEVGLDPIAAIQKSYDAGKSDEFIEPMLLRADSAMKDGDCVIFFNYRADRAREITTAITAGEFHEFDRGHGFKPSKYACMTLYDKNIHGVEVALGPQNQSHIFGEWLEENKLSQFRIAETEKYAHVTFFFNGGREQAFVGEDRAMIPSPRDCHTYDERPEMSAFQVAAEASKRISSGQYPFVLMNFANADMVGHTGNYEAALRAMETLDKCLAQVVGAGQKAGYHCLITADHGNAEEMRDEKGRIHTQHTLNPVPAIWVAPNTAIAPKSSRQALEDGTLEDVMPTLCNLMKLPIPSEVTGKNLVPKS